MTNEELSKIVEDAANNLGEYFDVVQISVSSHDSEGTGSVCRGKGNFYARLGLAQEFINGDRADILASKLADMLNCEEEE